MKKIEKQTHTHHRYLNKSYLMALLTLLMLSFGSTACQSNKQTEDNTQPALEERVPLVSLGEEYKAPISTDTSPATEKDLEWSVEEPEVASIVSEDSSQVVVKGLTEGITSVVLGSPSGQIKKAHHLKVTTDHVTKILTIGNSFSADAVEDYLHELAEAGGHEVIIANLYYGGRDLETHWQRASTDGNDYELRLIELDGSKQVYDSVTVKQAIGCENWDYISFQEVSQLSGQIEGYDLFLPLLIDYAWDLATNPRVKFILHQPWAYAKDASHPGFVNYDNDQMKMFTTIVATVWKAKEKNRIELIVPSGTAIQNARTSYLGDDLTRDGYHLSYSIGRFIAACTWYEAIWGNILDNPYQPEGFTQRDVHIAKEAASAAVAHPQEITSLAEL